MEYPSTQYWLIGSFCSFLANLQAHEKAYEFAGTSALIAIGAYLYGAAYVIKGENKKTENKS